MIFTEESTQIHVVISAILVITIGLSSGSDWPGGWYGLPRPKSGCSSSEWSGWWREDRRPNNQSTARVPQYSHLKGTFNQTITKRYFCIKKKDTGRDKPWPDGQYCIYKSFLKKCPSGFVNGTIGWKNKDVPNNNKHSGKIPSGVFTSNTRLNYCCKVEGSKENSIVLPTNTPFVLLAYNSSECQSVKWARSTQEYLRFSIQEDMTFKGSHPFVDKDHALRYCYYQASNKTVTYQQGTISRYLNRTSIRQERHTAWHIKPSQGPAFQLMVLRFTRFIFHANIDNSYLEVFDSSDESSPLLGRFSSTQSPLGQDLSSSTKQFFVVLHFVDRSGTYDFEFKYHTFFPTVHNLIQHEGTVAEFYNKTSNYTKRFMKWRIQSDIHSFGLVNLRFTRFIFLASDNKSNYLKVFDGSDESSPLLGRFSSTQSPLGQDLTSSTNQLFAALHFGDKSGTYDFEFKYHTFPTGSTTAKTKTSSTSTNSNFPTTQPPTSSPYASSSKVTSSSPYSESSSVTSSPTTNSTHGYLRYHDNKDKRKLLLSILLPMVGLVVIASLVVALFVLIRHRRRRRYSRMNVSVYDSDHELEDEMDGYFEEIHLSTSCSLLNLTNEPKTSSRQASNEILTQESQYLASSDSTGPDPHESDPDPYLSYLLNDLQLEESEQTELNEDQGLEMRLLKENQDEWFALRKPLHDQEEDKKNEASLC